MNVLCPRLADAVVGAAASFAPVEEQLEARPQSLSLGCTPREEGPERLSGGQRPISFSTFRLEAKICLVQPSLGFSEARDLGV